jgi:hypothetical protein
MAGYSKRSLAEKLGIKAGLHLFLLNPPEGYLAMIGPLPPNAIIEKRLPEQVDFIHYFTKEKAALEKEFPRLAESLSDKGALWISWPKGASKVPTDLSENIVRQIGLANTLVDIKVCAVDEIWSGLKFVRRLKDRRSASPSI